MATLPHSCPLEQTFYFINRPHTANIFGTSVNKYPIILKCLDLSTLIYLKTLICILKNHDILKNLDILKHLFYINLFLLIHFYQFIIINLLLSIYYYQFRFINFIYQFHFNNLIQSNFFTFIPWYTL